MFYICFCLWNYTLELYIIYVYGIIICFSVLLLSLVFFFYRMLFCILPMVIRSLRKFLHAYYGQGSILGTGHTHTHTRPNKHSLCS